MQQAHHERGAVNETIADANVTLEGGEYGLQTPWADRGIGINVGAEYRKELLNFNTDIEFQTGDLAGQGGPTLPTHGSFDVRELFTEIQVPIISHSFIEEFTITGGYRFSDYKIEVATASARIRTRSRPSSLRSATSGSVPATTAQSARRTSSSCSSRRPWACPWEPTCALTNPAKRQSSHKRNVPIRA